MKGKPSYPGGSSFFEETDACSAGYLFDNDDDDPDIADEDPYGNGVNVDDGWHEPQF